MFKDVFADIRANIENDRGFSQYQNQGAANNLTAGGINFGGSNPYSQRVKSTDDLIKQVTPEAAGILKQGTTDALALNDQSLQSQLGMLSGFQNQGATSEQAALLGLSGQDAQGQAISNIPMSAAQREADMMQSEQLRRQAASSGNLQSGAGLLSQQNLGAEQQASRISTRLQELEGLAGIDRSIASNISSLYESGGGRATTLQQGLGSQLANVYLGTAPAAAQSIQTRAELQGLSKIGAANSNAALTGQLANLAGQGFQAYQNYQNVQSDPYGFGGSDPFAFGGS